MLDGRNEETIDLILARVSIVHYPEKANATDLAASATRDIYQCFDSHPAQINERQVYVIRTPLA